MSVRYVQHALTVSPRKRGCHLIQDEILRHKGLSTDLRRFIVGQAHVFIQHTSASLTLNENADSDVPLDMEDTLNKIVPESSSYRHNAEGSDDFPAHVKASLFGSSVTIPITSGKFNLGTWQGIWLCEHRNHHGGSRNLIVTMHGQTSD